MYRLKGIKIPNKQVSKALSIAKATDNWRCVHCKSPITEVKYSCQGKMYAYHENGGLATYDHIVPRDLGGITHPANGQLMCEWCNGCKSNDNKVKSCDMAIDVSGVINSLAQMRATKKHTKHIQIISLLVDVLCREVGKLGTINVEDLPTLLICDTTDVEHSILMKSSLIDAFMRGDFIKTNFIKCIKPKITA